MGLDMYLSRKIYVGANYDYNNVKGTCNLQRNNKKIPINFNKIEYIIEDAGYWRKANHIHRWFVDNVQGGVDDCRTYYVQISQLKELLDLCKKVKNKAILKEGKIITGQRFENGEIENIYRDGKYIENAEEIAKILPTTSGFFFGSTEYDEYYMYDIDETIKIIEEQLKRDKELSEQGIDSYLEYSSSW